jgi:hypothetical protein
MRYEVGDPVIREALDHRKVLFPGHEFGPCRSGPRCGPRGGAIDAGGIDARIEAWYRAKKWSSL